MARAQRPLDPTSGLLGRFAAELRQLRESAGRPTYRELAARTHFAHSTLAEAAGGQTMPSLEVVTAFATACGVDPEPWRARWHTVAQGLLLVRAQPQQSASPWPEEPVRDGADPDASGCGRDAITAHARRVAITDRRIIVGIVQLRYSPAGGAAWARFEGLGPLDHIAGRQKVEIVVEVVREPDTVMASAREEYMFDYHWSDLLCTGRGPVLARAEIYADGARIAQAETDRMNLP